MEPTKAKRHILKPHYKAMWEEGCKRAQGYAVACGDLEAIILAKETARRALGSDLIAADFSRNRWAKAAVIEAIALIGVVLILWLR